jgi:hypothetical protein
VADAGLISAEFVPAASSSDAEVLAAAQSTAVTKGVTGSQLADSATVDPDVVQGFAQVARAFDQADAIARARIARVAAQNRTVAAANIGISGAGTFGASGAEGAAGSATSVVLNTSAGDAFAQATRFAQSSGAIVAAGSATSVVLNSSAGVAFVQATQAAQPSGAIIAAGLSSGSISSGLVAGVEGKVAGSEISLAGIPGALESGAFIGVAAGSESGGLTSGGSGGLTSGGSGDGAGSSFGGRFVPVELGSRTQSAGGSAATPQSAVGSTFNSALSAAASAAGSSVVSGLAAGESSVGTASASAYAAAAGSAGSASGEAALSGMPGSGVTSAITPQAIGGSLRVDSSGPVTVRGPVTADQLPVALDQTAIDLARLRGGMLTLELAPADLGRLSFEMRIDDSGAAFVAIRLADDTVRALVENAAGALRDSLSREGFKLDSFTVSSGFGSPEQRENSQNRGFDETSNRRVQSSDSSAGSRDSVQSRASNTQVRPGTSSLSLFA